MRNTIRYDYTRWRRDSNPIRVVEIDVAAKTLGISPQVMRQLVYDGHLTGYLNHDEELAFVEWRAIIAYLRRVRGGKG